MSNYEAEWIGNIKTATRDTTGQFVSKDSSIKQPAQDVTTIAKQEAKQKGDTSSSQDCR